MFASFSSQRTAIYVLFPFGTRKVKGKRTRLRLFQNLHGLVPDSFPADILIHYNILRDDEKVSCDVHSFFLDAFGQDF